MFWFWFKRVLGWIWASPVTFFGLLYSLLFWALRWHSWAGFEGDAFVWQLNKEKAPGWLLKLWEKWAGHSIGNVIVMNRDRSSVTYDVILSHELAHTKQVMRLGIFQPIIYAICMLAIKIGCENSHMYYDNIFEIDARRKAGQIIDVKNP